MDGYEQEVLTAVAKVILGAAAGWDHSEIALVRRCLRNASSALALWRFWLHTYVHRAPMQRESDLLLGSWRLRTSQLQPTHTMWNVLHWTSNSNYPRLGASALTRLFGVPAPRPCSVQALQLPHSLFPRPAPLGIVYVQPGPSSRTTKRRSRRQRRGTPRTPWSARSAPRSARYVAAHHSPTRAGSRSTRVLFLSNARLPRCLFTRVPCGWTRMQTEDFLSRTPAHMVAATHPGARERACVFPHRRVTRFERCQRPSLSVPSPTW